MQNHFITIPETTLPSGLVVPGFQVGQYVCAQGDDGQAVVTPEGAPWVNINYAEAKEACQKAGYQLLTESQWLAIAWNASQQDINWTGGKVGEGDLFQGLRNDTVNGAMPGNFESSDPTEQRWLTLSNGERICDLNGNVFQWLEDDVQGDENGLIAKAFAADSPSLTTAPYPSQKKGMGWHPGAGTNWSGYALIRGGCWGSESNAGAFSLGVGWPDLRYDSVGFRCTLPIGL
jgi:formylglycine-generating enzyme required for sulfatase activity